jgi:hypothetical protein
MCYILCIIVGGGFIRQLFGRFFAFGSFVVHGVSTHGFLIPVKN